ncbi:FecR family protein [Bdellovibrionota bacterium FG-1]
MRHNRICEGRAILMLSVLFLTGNAGASEQVGTLTQVAGEVKLFTHPAKKLQTGAGTHVLYEGEYYLAESATAGAKVEQGNIVRTAPGAKARVVFENGDQLNVGPATAMRIFWKRDAANTETRMDLAYGKIRGIVEKGGPRSHLRIHTKTATMGVRGTDFFIADDGKDGATEISIMRGTVEVTSNQVINAKPIEVKQGFSADIPSAPVVAAIELRKTTQEELQGIQRSSTIIKKPEEKAKEASPEIAKLEKQAVVTTLKDIKVYDPKLFAQITLTKPTSMDEINAHVVKELIKEAPRAPEQHKLHKSELDDLNQGAYEKYFKIQDG